MKRTGVALVPALWAAAALVLTGAAIAEIAAEPTSDPGIHSSFWTPTTAVTALFFGHGAYHGDFAPLSILCGGLVIGVVSSLAALLATALIVYALGSAPHPLAAALLGGACGLAAQILLVDLLCNWLQAENGIYTSLPSWAWFVAWGAWGTTLGLTISRAGRGASPELAPAVEGGRGRLAGPSPLLSGEPLPVAPHGRPLE